jgi:hypothetical protein
MSASTSSIVRVAVGVLCIENPLAELIFQYGTGLLSGKLEGSINRRLLGCCRLAQFAPRC